MAEYNAAETKRLLFYGIAASDADVAWAQLRAAAARVQELEDELQHAKDNYTEKLQENHGLRSDIAELTRERDLASEAARIEAEKVTALREQRDLVGG